MRKGVLAAIGAAMLAAACCNSAPAQAMPMSASAALKGAADGLTLTDKVWCYDSCGGGYGYRPYYRPYGGYYRPYYRSYYGYGYGYRPYYRPYYGYRHYGYGYGYRPYYRPGYGYGYGPRPRFYVGNAVYWY